VESPASGECEAVPRLLGPNPGPQELIRIAEHAAASGDAAAAKAKLYAQLAGRRVDIACRKGCPHCCHIRVMATAPEVLCAADFIRRTFSQERQTALLQKLRETDEVTRGLDTAARAQTRLPCPLLEDDCCSVHPARPLRCRGLASFDAEACRRSFGEAAGALPVPMFTPQADLLEDAQSGMMVGLAAAGYDSHPLELTAALRIALEEPDAAERWLAGAPVFRAARIAITRRR